MRLLPTGRVSASALFVRVLPSRALFFRALRLLACCLIWTLAFRGAAQGISYTVQVAALSEQGSAEALRRTLREAGYPAYLVSVPGEAQTVYRLRVGAFADREAAQTYAAAMRGVGGTVPVPALAEGIPPDLIPLEPSFVARYPFFTDRTRLEVVPWGDAAALRVQGFFEAEPLQATYRVLQDALAAAPFSAWRAAPAPNDPSGAATRQTAVAERVTNLPLFAEGEVVTLPDGGLTETGQARLAEAAEALGLTPEQVQPYIFYEPGRGAPFLVVAERFDPVTRTGGRYPALGNPGTGRLAPPGPSLTWFGRSAPEAFPDTLTEPLFALSSLVQGGRVVPPAGVRVAGQGWEARRDGQFTALTVGDRSWRALVGQPLWAGNDFLLVYAAQEVVLYRVTLSQPARNSR